MENTRVQQARQSPMTSIMRVHKKPMNFPANSKDKLWGSIKKCCRLPCENPNL